MKTPARENSPRGQTARLFLLTGLMGLSACSLMPASTGETYETLAAVPYRSDPHPRQIADLYLPPGAGPHPAVLLIHGGGWQRGEPADMNRYARRLVQAGYVVMNLAYRLAPEHRFPAQSEDVAAAHAWLVDQAGRYRVDPTRIAAFGYSAGAHLALMQGLAPGDTRPRLKAVVAGAGPTDMSDYYDSPYLDRLIGGSGHQYPERYAAASPLQQVSADDPPVLLYHGTWDRLVAFEQSRKLADALAQAGVEQELVAMPLRGHITAFLFDGAAYERIQAFLDRHLAAPGPSGGGR